MVLYGDYCRLGNFSCGEFFGGSPSTTKIKPTKYFLPLTYGVNLYCRVVTATKIKPGENFIDKIFYCQKISYLRYMYMALSTWFDAHPSHGNITKQIPAFVLYACINHKHCHGMGAHLITKTLLYAIVFVCCCWQEGLFGQITKVTSIQLSRNQFVTFPITDPSHLQNIEVISY